MDVRLAKTAGFCFGVKRAVDTVYQQVELNRDEKIYTYGPIIHNDEVVKDMKKHGVEVIHSEDELKQLTSAGSVWNGGRCRQDSECHGRKRDYLCRCNLSIC